MRSKNAKYVCRTRRCNWRGYAHELLSAPNPFDTEVMITGCPTCREVDCMVLSCDENGCWDAVVCGTPTPTGYRRTCGVHVPESFHKKG